MPMSTLLAYLSPQFASLSPYQMLPPHVPQYF
jgi:hypothetical protein